MTTHPTTDTKQRLIDTALALIWRNSYGSVSVDDICKAADVKKGSFYHFFPSKVDLAIAAMEESYKAMKPLLDGIFSAENPPLERFDRMADFVYQGQLEAKEKYGAVCGCPCASLGCEMASQEEGIRAKFDEMTNRHEKYYESALRDLIADKTLPADTDIKAKGREIYAYMIGQMTIARIQNDLEPLKRDLKDGLRGILGVETKIPAAA